MGNAIVRAARAIAGDVDADAVAAEQGALAVADAEARLSNIPALADADKGQGIDISDR